MAVTSAECVFLLELHHSEEGFTLRRDAGNYWPNYTA